MIVFLIVIFVISAILLTTVILLQDDQGEGIGGLFGGGSGTAFGSRTGNVLTKFTSVLAAIFLVTAFAVAWLNRSGTEEDIEAKARAKALEEVEASDWYIRAGEASGGDEEPASPEGEEAEAPAEASPAAAEDSPERQTSADTSESDTSAVGRSDGAALESLETPEGETDTESP